MKKALNFAAIHFTIAFTVAFVLTGDIIIGSLIALLEPAVNTVAFYFHERVWSRFQMLKMAASARIKTGSFAVVHFGVAFTVGYLLSGDFLVGGLVAAVEPCFNTVAYYFFERNWQRKCRQSQLQSPELAF